MAWTTKSPIQGNHWVPLGCRVLLGYITSVVYPKRAQSAIPEHVFPKKSGWSLSLSIQKDS
jgi:hypothetical protein